MTRIITGTAKNTTLEVPEIGTRPITDRAKSALFSIIADWISGSNILDLYAGSGSLGIEALSRGALHATFVDNSREAIKYIERNLEKTKLASKADVNQMTVEKYIELCQKKKFDVIFLDPPYNKLVLQDIESSTKCLLDDGLIILKHSPQFIPPQKTNATKLIESRKYGENVLSFFKKNIS